jgi:hypothetical protein
MIITMWLDAKEIVEVLAGCTATAFLYSTGNSGTSGAIRLGIAARRPMIAFPSRQNRDLYNEPAIDWVHDKDTLEVLKNYERLVLEQADKITMMKELADRQSWANSAEQYKKLWHEAWLRR